MSGGEPDPPLSRSEPVFVPRETYRGRRLMDAARIMPFFGAFLFAVPTIIAAGIGTAEGIAYLFGSWLVLIVLAAIISRRLTRERPASFLPRFSVRGRRR